MHHILTVFGTYGKSIKPYNIKSVQNVADVDGIYTFLSVTKEKGWAILYFSLQMLCHRLWPHIPVQTVMSCVVAARG
jgi:hypothetical protein